MMPKCRKESIERTFWRKTEHRNKDTKNTKSSQWFTRILSYKRVFNHGEDKGYSLYVPKLNSTRFFLTTSSKFSNNNY